MIPVPDSELERIDINKTRNSEDKHYGNLLLKQYLFLNSNEERIQKKAKSLYKNKKRGNIPFFEKMCCDFEKLEKEHDGFIMKKEEQIRRNRMAHIKSMGRNER